VQHAALEPAPRDGSRALEEIFGLLAAAYPREPIDAALGAIRRGGAARGTALEWLDVLLPTEVKLALWPRLVRSDERIVPTPRGLDDLRRALVSGHAGAARPGDPDGEGEGSGPA
jgi:hypothetical protein